MKVWIAYVVTQSEQTEMGEVVYATEKIGTFSTEARAMDEAARVGLLTGNSGRVAEVEVDVVADWATDQALAEDLAAQRG